MGKSSLYVLPRLAFLKALILEHYRIPSFKYYDLKFDGIQER